MNSASKILAEEIDNLSLLLVIADSADADSLADAMAVFRKIEEAVGNNNLPEKLTSQVVQLLNSVNSSANEQKYESLKKLASSAQALLTGYLEHHENASAGEEDHNEIATEAAIPNSPNLDDVLESFFDTHSMLMRDIMEKFSAIQKSDTLGKTVSADLHQEVESYVLRLNQDAIKIDCKPLITIAQNLFMLLMQYPLVDIEDEMRLVGDFILRSLKNPAKIEISEDLTAAMKAIEDKLSGSYVYSRVSGPEVSVSPEVSSEVVDVAKELGVYTIDADSEILSEFVAEARDHLNAVESVLLERALDFTGEDVDTLFRGVHSLKGTSSYFNLLEINESSHLLENILDEVRKGTRVLDLELKSLVLRYVDIQNTLLKLAQEAVGKGGIIQRSSEVHKFIIDIEDFFNKKSAHSSALKNDLVIEPEVSLNVTPEVADPSSQQVVAETTPLAAIETPAKQSQPVESKPKAQASQSSKDGSNIKSFVKIDTERLDSLGEMIGEMVIYSSMLIRRCRELLPQDEGTMRMSDQVEKFSRELQDIGMSMRLDPIRGLFQKLSRLVWDTSKKLGKEVKFVVKGEDTELDRNVIERLADPLMHMVRNSLDHGVEDPETRVALGKDRVGVIELSSSHEGGSIVIKIKDDGRGLDAAKLLQKAIEKGIVSREANLSEQEIFQLIFAPGFSTAEKVTDISGRGVGMDVVRTNIESMRGRIQIESALGKGSTFSIELPLTLAIIEGIEATVGVEKFIFPMLSVVELIRPTLAMIGSSMHSDETFLFRGKHLPMFRLSNIFSVPSTVKCPTEGRMVILNNGGELVALLVDEIGGNCQTVIKNLGPLFEKQCGIAGCAIVNNGDIGLIIDVRSLVQVARSDSRGKELTKRSVAKLAES